MPRAVVVQAKPTQPLPVGRNGKKVVAMAGTTRNFGVVEDIVRHPDVKESCPLCIEPFDSTDVAFSPCPCGYRVCLFCYNQVKLLCKGLCPGCRREYGTVEDDVTTRSSDSSPEPGSSRSSTMGGTAAAPLLNGVKPHANGQAGQQAVGAGAAGRNNLGTAKPVPAQAVKKPPEPPARREEAGLPSGATWAASGVAQRPPAAEPDRQPAPAPVTVDESAWPSLAGATAATREVKHHRQDSVASSQLGETSGQNQDDHHRRSISTSFVSEDRGASSNSLDQLTSNDPVVPDRLHQSQQQFQSTSYNVPPHLADAFSTAQVSATVHGVRRAVNVPLSTNGVVEVYAEAPAMVASLKQAVSTGTLNGQEAAAHLMALLRQKDKEAPGTRSLLAAGKPPPGFASIQMPSPTPAAPAQPSSSVLHSLNPLNNQDNPIVPGPPTGRFQPISPPIQHNGSMLYAASAAPGSKPVQQQRQNGYTLASGLQHAPGTYSMWSGLPGIDLSLNGPLTTLWAGTSYHQVNYGNGVSPLDPPVPSAAAKNPPPGFGPSPYTVVENGVLKHGYRPAPYQPLANSAVQGGGSTGGYNPLQAQYATAPGSRPAVPPGMQAYRPQLGTGA